MCCMLSGSERREISNSQFDVSVRCVCGTGAVANGAVANGAVANGAVANGAVANGAVANGAVAVSYIHLRAHEIVQEYACRLLSEK